MDSAIAYHEAGHAVMAVWLGGEVLRVTIEPDHDDGPRRDGEAMVRWHHRGLTARQLRERELMTVLAGPIAEMTHQETNLPISSLPQWAEDFRIACEISAMIVELPSQRRRMLEAVTDQVHLLVKRHDFWQAIAEVADQLEAYETIEGEEVSECVNRWLS